MVKFINKLSHGEMWVADEREEEYKAAGHRLAADSLEPKPSKPVKKTVKKK